MVLVDEKQYFQQLSFFSPLSLSKEERRAPHTLALFLFFFFFFFLVRLVIAYQSIALSLKSRLALTKRDDIAPETYR